MSTSRASERMLESLTSRGHSADEASRIVAEERAHDQLAAEFAYRSTLAEGLLQAVATPRGGEKVREFLGVEEMDVNELRRLIAREVRETRAIAEAFGYSRATNGTFFGRHGLDRAVRHRTMNRRHDGASTCASCGSLKPTKDAMCPNCGKGSPDILSRLEEMRSAGGGGGSGPAPSIGGVKTPVAAKPKGRGRKGTGDPKKNAENIEFEKLHPRLKSGRMGGGQFMQKGEGEGDKFGSSRVLLLQQRLGQLGHQLLEEDGVFGPRTEAAVKEFQRQYGLSPTGVVDRATMETLRNPPPIDVSTADAQVNEMENPRSGRSGSRSPSSASGRGQSVDAKNPESIRKFQKEHGLRVTGTVDPETRGAMRALDAERGGGTTASAGGGKSTGGGKSKGKKDGTSNLTRRGDGMSGDTDKKVEQAQQMLDDLGFDLGEGGVDGRFGEDTEAAIRKFQQRYGLRVDGVIGPQTLAMLKRIQRRQTKDSKDAGHLSADQEEQASSGRKKVEEASYRNITGTGVTKYGTKVDYGGIAPFLLDPTKRGNLGKQPPNLRRAEDWEACHNCVFFTGTGIPVQDCRLWAWPVDEDDLCDSHATLTPERQRHIAGYTAAVQEAMRALSDGRGSDVARLRSRASHHARKLEESVRQEVQSYSQRSDSEKEGGTPAKRAERSVKRTRKRAKKLSAGGDLKLGKETTVGDLQEVKSSAYPGLDRSKKENWVDKAGGLPSYIERIAKHLHYEKGMNIGRAIATAVNVVKKMCGSGDTNFPGKQNVNKGSRAEACAAVASWEKKKIQHAAVIMETVHTIERLSVDKGSLSLRFAIDTMTEIAAIDKAIAEGTYKYEEGKTYVDA